MENDAGEFVDLYCPRKWYILSSKCFQFKLNFVIYFSSSSHRIIHAKDHASVQLNIADVDPETGRMTGSSKVYAICGAIRRMGESDDCLCRLAKKDNLVSKVL